MATSSENQPLISCLCVTRNKVQQLNRAIDCFFAQTYPNKELVIVYEDNDRDTQDFLAGIESDQVRKVEVKAEPKLPLGELRNLSIAHSAGEYFCQWDDDDWYHARRLYVQMSALQSSHHPVSVLTNWLMFDQVKKQAYFSIIRLWEGSILCRKDLITDQVKYPAMSRQEDTFFISTVLLKSRIYPVVSPNLYIYVYHGNNTWELPHFRTLFANSKKLSPAVASLIGDILEGKYPVAEASALLDAPEVLGEIEYFHEYKKNKKFLLKIN
jgi:glycosyltransferase involved in cell wall biosynthesis